MASASSPRPAPTALVIFGASGDLTKRKLLPAIYQLTRLHRLPPRLAVIGVANHAPRLTRGSGEVLTDSLHEFADVEGADEVAKSLASNMHYVQGDLTDAALYERLKAKLSRSWHRPQGVLFYLAIPPLTLRAPPWPRTSVEPGLTAGGGRG